MAPGQGHLGQALWLESWDMTAMMNPGFLVRIMVVCLCPAVLVPTLNAPQVNAMTLEPWEGVL